MTSFDTPAELPWYKSRVIVGALVSAIFKLLATIGVATDFSEEESGAIVTALMVGISFLGDYIATRARLTQKTAPPIRLRNGNPEARSPWLVGLLAGVLLLLSGCSLVPLIGLGPSGPGGNPVSEAVDTAAFESTRAFALGELVYTQVARGATELVGLGVLGRSDLVTLRDLNSQALTWLERGHAATTSAGKLASAEGLLGIIDAIEAINPGPAIAPAGTTELRAELAEARQGEMR